MNTRFLFVRFSAKCFGFFGYVLSFTSVSFFLSAYSGEVSFLSAVIAEFIQCREFVCWVPIWCITKFAGFFVHCSVFRSGSESFHSLYWFFFYFFFRLVIRASGIVFFRFFLSYVFCFIILIVLFSSSFFSFISLSRSFVFVIAVIYFEMSRSSAVIPSNAHSFSISINLRQKSSGVFVSVYFVQKNSPRL